MTWSHAASAFRAAARERILVMDGAMGTEIQNLRLSEAEFRGERFRDHGHDQRGNALAVQAHVPLGEMFGYATDLRSSTQGRATYTMQFEQYEEVPSNIAEEIVASRSGDPAGAAA